MEQINIQQLTFTYPGRETPSLKGISLSIQAGEFVTLCGTSGCGKSTLLRQLKPVLTPHGKKCGVVWLNGADVTMLSHREQAENIGFVLQSPDHQMVCDKVWHELAFGLESLALPREEIRARVAEMTAFFGIQDWYDRDVSTLSGGQKQLLNLAAVMVMQPSVLILDEPTSQLDPITAHDFLNTLAQLNRELGVTVILSEHRLEEVLPLSDRVLVMDDGQIIANGTVAEVGQILKKADHTMLLALPTPMRVYYTKEREGCPPVTIREGRQWLQRIPLRPEAINQMTKPLPCTPVVLELKEVWFRYEKTAPDVLQGLNLTLHQQEFYAMVGGNGAGKSTMLSVILGIAKVQHGTIIAAMGTRIAALPQDPQSLFVKKTVELELRDMIEDIEEPEERLQWVIDFCELSGLLEQHPYDLSGGEQQRVALAKVLLVQPELLLLDEPTKGLDAHFKQKLAGLLKELQKQGMTILMVSHDVEFCARYADRLGLFFRGNVVSEDRPRSFFADKRFYTTAANRMARGVLSGAVTEEDLVAAVGGSQEKLKLEKPPAVPVPKAKLSKAKNIAQKQHITLAGGLVSLALGGLFLISLWWMTRLKNIGEAYTTRSYLLQLVSLLLLGGAFYPLLPKGRRIQMVVPKRGKGFEKRSWIAVLTVLLLVPLTVLAGVFFLEDRKYYIISLCIIAEIMFPFGLLFESRKPQARELVLISVFCAITVAGRIVFAMLPQFKPMLALIIIAGLYFGGETGFLVGAVTAFVSNFYFMQGPWTPWQMFAYGIVGFLAGMLFGTGRLPRHKSIVCVFGFLAAWLICGTILNLGTVFMGQEAITPGLILTTIVMGLPLDLIHGASTAFFLWVVLEPMGEKLERIKEKYGF